MDCDIGKDTERYYKNPNDGTKWNKQKSSTNYLLLGIWGNKKDNVNVYVVGIKSDSYYDHLLDVSSRKSGN
ncbi:MAG: hypothetical protein JETT_2720 [Candidatus Jettenia ecosi]|uniref:Uncharacterized protein n=1 Tax=Candidatus Jettenia ecosi TaxID=2494326 RepID=A0A533Q8R5_9BACT|nr:MAG: hypothetical protein JETT_2720 [Candidatus Jettenia ecosi]